MCHIGRSGQGVSAQVLLQPWGNRGQARLLRVLATLGSMGSDVGMAEIIQEQHDSTD